MAEQMGRRQSTHMEHQQSFKQASVTVGKHPADDAEREKNRALLKSLKDHQVIVIEDLENLKTAMPKVTKDVQELRSSLNASIQSVVNSMVPSMIRSLETENASLKQQLQKLTVENQKVTSEVGKIQKLTADNQKMQAQMQKAEKMVQDMERAKKEQQAGLKEVKEFAKSMQNMKQEIQKIKGDSASKQEMERLKSGMHSKDVLTRVQSKVDMTTLEFNELRQKIFDRGLLAPPRVEPVNEESPPVGTVELCEDVFTAQLLMRLSFDKQALTDLAAGDKEKRDKGPKSSRDYSAVDNTPREVRLVKSDESDSEYELSAAEMLALEQFGNVSGIADPEDGVNREVVIPMWTAISFITLILQIVVVVLMMQFYIMTPGCFEVLPQPFIDPDWWVLHVSRGLAMLVCGAIMTRDFMDSLNYLMTSILLEPHMSATVVLSFLGRVLLNVFLVMANIYLYMSFTQAGYLWVNMACLGFIATLDRDVLSLAKRGVFGHQISKAVTGVKYEITFLHEYPGWFTYVSKTTIMVCIIGVTMTAVLCFLEPDRTC